MHVVNGVLIIGLGEALSLAGLLFVIALFVGAAVDWYLTSRR